METINEKLQYINSMIEKTKELYTPGVKKEILNIIEEGLDEMESPDFIRILDNFTLGFAEAYGMRDVKSMEYCMNLAIECSRSLLIYMVTLTERTKRNNDETAVYNV